MSETTYQHSVDTSAPAGTVWQLYRDVAGWPSWNSGVQQVELDGEFTTGTTGRLTPPGAGPLPFRIVAAHEDAGYTSETEIADTVTLRSTSSLVPLPDGGTRITLRSELIGPAAAYFAESFGPALATGVPSTVRELARRAAVLADLGARP
jgi:hypothetical protein